MGYESVSIIKVGKDGDDVIEMQENRSCIQCAGSWLCEQVFEYLRAMDCCYASHPGLSSDVWIAHNYLLS